ncbi:MAG: nucleoside monophosphate kinase [Candidatus Shapirobacteria bacterium]
MSLNLLIIGPSGGGVSYQAKSLAAKYGLACISMGQLLRDQIDQATEIGQRAKPFIDQGLWVPDEITFTVLKEALSAAGNSNFILDGFPRAFNQGPLLEEYLKGFDQSVNLLIHLNVPFTEIQSRRQSSESLGLHFHQEKRSDDTPVSITNQQKAYADTINPILEYFNLKDLLFQVDGNRTKDDVFNYICQAVDKLEPTKKDV